MASDPVLKCARCGAAGHVASSCSRPFLRSFCSCCRRPGHDETTCAQKRRADAEQRKAKAEEEDAEWLASVKPERRARILEQRKAAAQAKLEVQAKAKDDEDARSVVSATSTAATAAEARGPRLSEIEEKEARKHEKALRDISKLAERLAQGEQLETKQLEKIQRRREIEHSLVMRKIRVGYARHPLGTAKCVA